eukprot:CAMPEP_0113504158 /NCGR_PEP_ID=MMETSP0014_2-20120614/34567_1 /TAXON_ID=2857 /ORGANISM="Nitzschia sp." /LENGTH=67 /DNA_ID=CAMNT_0000399251 /DNA_START=77 /DNA_END=280 /DNA_ORIENTATION=+ /assembly_acc=CAM_ASM_000159
MPWQSLSSLAVVITMFNVAGALVGSIQYLSYGKSKELGLPGNEFNYRMDKRDDMYNRMLKEVQRSTK